MNVSKTTDKRRLLLGLIGIVSVMIVLIFACCFPVLAANTDEDHVQIGDQAYIITDAKSLVDADLALLRWRSKGDTTSVSAVIDGESFSGFDAVYAKVYDKLLALFDDKSDSSVVYYDIAADNTPSSDGYIANTLPTGETKNSTVIWKVTGEVTLKAGKPISNVGRVIIISEDAATIKMTAEASQFLVKGTASFVIQGRSVNQNIKVTSTSSTKTKNSFQVDGGSLYLQYCDLDGFKYSSTSVSVICFPTGNYARYLYMSDSKLRNINAREAPGIFCKAYSTGSSNDKVIQSKLYINYSEFSNCVTNSGASDTVGGSAIRSYAADVCDLTVRNCTFTSNRVGSKTAAQTGVATGGGAIYWKSVGGKATLISCTFKNNHSSVVGGAILNMGTMEIIGCNFENNTAFQSGGAIAVETPYTSSEYTSITGSTSENKQNNLSGTLTLDSNTKIIGNTANQIGGGIYFNAVSSQISSKYQITKYQMQLIINGAEITGNTSGTNGGGVGIYMNYDDREYKTGVIINEGSLIANNVAAQNGGAIWINSAEACDCKENQGVVMNGGTLENNLAINGGAIYIDTGKNGVEMNYFINSGNVYRNSATSNGGAAYIQGGNVIMSGGIIADCTANVNGGAVYVSGGDATISGGEISDCEAAEDGGAFYMTAGSVTLSGNAVLSRCTAKNGGVVYMGGGTLNMNGGTLSSNTAINGAGAYLANGTMTISGGTVIDNIASQNGGAAYLGGGNMNVTDGTISTNVAVNGAGAYLASGTLSVSGGNIISNNGSQNGGGAYLAGGTMIFSGGTVSTNMAVNGAGAYLAGGTMTVSGGNLTSNVASMDGGGAYLAGGSFTITNGTITGNTAVNGAGALVANGNVNVSGGSITQNVAAQNGGAFSITNGNYTMIGGSVTHNIATNGDGGAIYISSTQDNTNIIIRSGTIIDNQAGNSGGALGVYGQDGVKFTITIGSNTNHKDRDNCHVCVDNASIDESCPVIKNNSSVTSGGGIYLSGSYDAVMNMHCLVEENNTVGDGISNSNFMKVEGGTLNINTEGANKEEDCGNVVINSSIHVTGGKVTLHGSGSNPMFKEPVTVDINTEGSSFTDARDGGNARTIQYFENFVIGGQMSGRYVLIDYISTDPHIVRANMYSNTGYEVDGWTLMTTDANGNHVSTGRIFKAGDEITDTGKLIFYAKWVVVGYTVIFDPGVDSYRGSMDPQDFAYNDKKALLENAFINVGYKFLYWVDASDPTKIYTDGQVVEGLSQTHGSKINLIAVWEICTHNDTEYILTTSGSIATRQCECLGFTEMASISGITTVYDANPHGVNVNYNRESLNGLNPDELWSFTVLYNGTSNGGETLSDSTLAPINAGSYTAGFEVGEGKSISVNIIINRANREQAPNLPEYTTEVDNKGTNNPNDDVNIIKIQTPTDTTGYPLEYQFSWYEGQSLKQSNWQSWNAQNPPTQQLKVTYTNYYVDVRYAQTDNYNASSIVRGTSVIVWTGNVTFKFTSGQGLSHSHVTSNNKDGITVTLTPLEGYYIYNIVTTVSEIPDYTLPVMDETTKTSDSWVIWIHSIAEAPKGSGITIEILFTGAEKTIDVDSSTVKDEAFNDISSSGEENVTISSDSAFTVAFNASNFKHYVNPSITFSSAIPSGSTVIMIDKSDYSYWGYTATANVTSIPLTDFVKMGTQNEKFSIDGKEAYNLQFVVDFSNCQSYPTANTLVTSFAATPVQPSGITTVPAMPSSSDVKSTIQFMSTPTFNIESDETATDSTSHSLAYQFAVTSGTNVGTSKWNDIGAMLLVVPEDASILPKDARLQVKIGDSTEIYPLINGKFTVALPSNNTGVASLTLLSDMMPNEDISFMFTVQLCASATKVQNTPNGEELNVADITISYSVKKTDDPEIFAQINGDLPKYENGNITPLYFAVSVENLPQNYTVRAMLYSKNANGGYTSTTQTMNLPLVDNSFEGVIDLVSFKEEMSQAVGSLSLMVSIEIVDLNGAVVESVPLYFILVDARQ